MRPVELWYHGVEVVVEIAPICELMLAIESGEAGRPEFEIAELDFGATIVDDTEVGLVGSGAHAWTLERGRGKRHFFLAMGGRRPYLECIDCGAPERIRACCLLSLDDAVPALERLIDGAELPPPFHWVSMRRALEQSGESDSE